MIKITGMLTIGNGEKCPFCDTVIEQDTDVFLHMTNKHKDEWLKALFDED